MLPLYQNIKSRRTELKMSQDTLAELTGYKWWKRKFKITIPALAAIIYKVEFLPEPKEIPLPMLDDASLDIDRKRFRTEHEIRAEHEN